MSWRVIFTGAVALLVAVLVGLLALAIRSEYPWLSGVAVIADIGVIVAGLKAVLDTTKTANELRKMGYEIEKLKLEIAEKKHTAEKQDSRIIAASLDEIVKYFKAVPARGSILYMGTTALLVVVCVGIFWHPPPSPLKDSPMYAFPRKAGIPAYSKEEAGELGRRLDKLRLRASAVSDYLDELDGSAPNVSPAIAKKEVEMFWYLGHAQTSYSTDQIKDSERFAEHAEELTDQLEEYVSLQKQKHPDAR